MEENTIGYSLNSPLTGRPFTVITNRPSAEGSRSTIEASAVPPVPLEQKRLALPEIRFLRLVVQYIQWQFQKVVLRSGTASNFHQRQGKGEKKITTPLDGWRAGLLGSTVLVGVCVLVDVTLLILALIFYRPTNGVGTVSIGKCSHLKNVSDYLLIPLNIIGTVTVACSNYVMQTLNAPSRTEIDKAHAKGHFVNIGVSSLSNLKYISYRKTTLYCLLGLSTVPIHLLLNSLFFVALQANNYGVMIVSKDFLQDQSWDMHHEEAIQTVSGTFLYNLRNSVLDNSTHIRDLDVEHCTSAYSGAILSKSSNVILITSATSDHWANIPPLETNVTFECTDLERNNCDKWQASLDPIYGTVSFVSQCSNWTGGQLQRTGTGLYLDSADPLWAIRSLRAAFNAFDYKYWAVAEGTKYNFNNPVAVYRNQWEPPSWLCDWKKYTLTGKQCSGAKAIDNTSGWMVTPKGFKIDRCLSTTSEEKCTLQYSLSIMIAILVGEIIKLITLRFALETLDIETAGSLVTVGDAVASFLISHDRSGVGNRCPDDPMNDNDTDEIREPGWINQHQNMFHLRWLFPARAQRHLRRPIHNSLKESEDKPVSLGAYVFSTTSQRDERKGRNAQERKREYAARKRMWPTVYSPAASVWMPHKTRWFDVPSKMRWLTFGLLFVICLFSAATIFIVGVRNLQGVGLINLWHHGLGTVDPNAVFTATNTAGETGGVMRDIVLVNLPQLLLSALYFQYNGMFTSMRAGYEWSLFGVQRKTLRVSHPTHQQRSTYWLSLPLRYSIPLMAFSSLMHWLLGRSLFLVRILVYDFNNQPAPERDVTACGYSPLAILLVIAFLLVMLAVLLLCSRQRLARVSPMVGPGSWAISAACHDDDPDAAFKALKWGVKDPGSSSEAGRLCLSSHDVQEPVVGHLYWQ